MFELEIQNHYANEMAEVYGIVDSVNPVMGVVIKQTENGRHVAAVFAAENEAALFALLRKRNMAPNKVVDRRKENV